MPNYGCWITIKRYTERKPKQQKRRRKFMKLSIFSLGKMKTNPEILKLPKKRNLENKKCSSINGIKKCLEIPKPIDKNSC